MKVLLTGFDMPKISPIGDEHAFRTAVDAVARDACDVVPRIVDHLKIAHAWKPLQKQEHCKLRQLPEQEFSC